MAISLQLDRYYSHADLKTFDEAGYCMPQPHQICEMSTTMKGSLKTTIVSKNHLLRNPFRRLWYLNEIVVDGSPEKLTSECYSWGFFHGACRKFKHATLPTFMLEALRHVPP